MFPKEVEFYWRRANVFRDRVKEEIYSEQVDLQCEYARSQDPVKFPDRLALAYKPLHRGEKWGENWESAWFHITGSVPEHFAGREIALLADFGGEALIFDAEGTPVYGLTNASAFSDRYTKNRYLLKGSHSAGEKLEFWIEGAANGLFGLVFEKEKELRRQHPQGRFTGTLVSCSLAVFEREVWHLYLDLLVLCSLIEGLPENDFRRGRFLHRISKAADAYNDTPGNAAAARAVLKQIFDVAPSASMMTAHAVGHAHIDTGWLWPVRETIRKCARTYSSQLALMEEYPDYVFGASAAQHYAFVKEHYPSLYRKIRSAIASGQWEIQGGMWVEADCNLISGESMVRQFLHGKNFFMDEFGFDVKNLWIPDVFGYSAALPQIIRKSGCEFFLTQKLSWSQFNRFPYQSFRWQGIDGSEVLTHFPPEDTYNSMLQPKELMHAQNRYTEGDTLSDFMSLYGIGDGGGGPFTELVEIGRREAALDGCPHVQFDRADRFFERLNEHRPELPVWKGELYLELHRGTLTTQSRTKRNNRKCEQILTETEFLCSLLPAEQYPAKELDGAWKLLLLNQFHDIIPGSSITKVYETTEKEHAQLLALCESLIARASGELFPKSADHALVLNSLSCDCETLVELPASWNGFSVLDDSGAELPVQQENGRTLVQLFLPKSSLTLLKKGARGVTPDAKRVSDDLVLENGLVRYTFSPDGRLLEAIDKTTGESILKPGESGNVFSLYVDNPICWDAWDVDVYYPRQEALHPTPVRARKTVSGPLRSVLEFELALSASTIRQTVVLESSGTRLDFHTEVEWHESHRMLRTAFPVNIFSDTASFDIQYGYVRRTMLNNTSWDMAQFEAVGQRYADISDHSHGVALLNDCKYGHKVKDGVLDLALLRSSTAPDSSADQGHHTFTYSLLPHKGALVDSNVMSQSALLNRRPRVIDGVKNGALPPCVLESDSVSLEVVKKAEKENCLVIRAVETHGAAAKAVLHLRDKALRVIETNLLEWTEDAVFQPVNGDLELTFRPFEIRTFKLKA